MGPSNYMNPHSHDPSAVPYYMTPQDPYSFQRTASTGSGGNLGMGSMGNLTAGLPGSGSLPAAGGGAASLYVKNLPAEADRLFLYEKFAPYGAILSIKVCVYKKPFNSWCMS